VTPQQPAPHDDPFELFGLPRSATLAELRAARRELAFAAHPDRGGDVAAMQRINLAFDAAVAHITGRRPLPVTVFGPSAAATPQRPVGRPVRDVRTHRRGVQRDVPSFTIDALPVEAFEALLVVTSWIGEVLVDDPPYLLEVHLHDPAPCWCRLDLVPDAGGSTVTLTVAAVGGAEAPHVETVRDLWVAQLNRLGSDGT
jgi:hypothetical protein